MPPAPWMGEARHKPPRSEVQCVVHSFCLIIGSPLRATLLRFGLRPP